MADSVVLPVPDQLLAMYAVATSGSPDQESVRDLVRTDVGLTVEVVPVADAPMPPLPLLRAMGSPAADLAAVDEADSVAIVQALGDASWPPVHEFAARGAGCQLATAYGGVVVDLRIPRTSPAPVPADVGAAVEGFRLVDWVLLPHSQKGSGLWFTTKGLSRFGLPELQSHDVPGEYTGAWGAVMSGIAHVLLRDQWSGLREQPAAAFREVAAEQLLTLRDVALAYSDRARTADDPALDVGAAFRIELDPATAAEDESYLAVVPPASFDGGASAWCRHVVASVFGAAGRTPPRKTA